MMRATMPRDMPMVCTADRAAALAFLAVRYCPDVAARDVYLMIASMAYFYLSNRFTLSSFLGENLEAPEALAHWEAFVIDAVRRTVCLSPAEGASNPA